MKLSMRNQIILAIAGVVALTLAVTFLVIWPQFQKLGQLGEEVKAQDQEIVAARTLLDRRIEARDNAARTSAELILQSNRVPDAPELPALIIEIQDAAEAAGLTFERVTPKADSGDLGTYTAYQAELRLIGRWADYIDFMRRLGKMTRGVRVLQTDIQRQDVPSTPGTATVTTETETEVEVTMNIEVYTVNDNASTGATAPPAATP